MKRRYLGRAGHVIVSRDCQFHIHTHIGKWCISTVGEYYPRSIPSDGPPEPIGSGRVYETMVFNLRSRENRWANVDFAGYNDMRKAEEGHEEMCRKYESKYE
jgi:hypothetical protein